MLFHEISLEGAYIIELERRTDHRGYFARNFCKSEFESYGLENALSQMNVSYSAKARTLRGLHYQIKPFQEVKVVRCTRGRVLDVIVDLRPSSKTFKSHFKYELSEENSSMIYVPAGFAHGFITLEDDCEIAYLVSTGYSPLHERTLHWRDPFHSIDWPFTPDVISSKDDQSRFIDDDALAELQL
jgi:dTDP-4-dehydrorhamnose 3,5-epimerase